MMRVCVDCCVLLGYQRELAALFLAAADQEAAPVEEVVEEPAAEEGKVLCTVQSTFLCRMMCVMF